MMNIVVPMAGAGSRFADVGYKDPKPFIDVAGQPMIERVMENLRCANSRFIMIARREHLVGREAIVAHLEKRFNAHFVLIDGLTEGMVCTVLKADAFINNDDGLLLANSDQLVDITISDFVQNARERELDGSIMAFEDSRRDPKWSFAQIDNNGLVIRTKEKEAISPYATVGIYYYNNGGTFVQSACEMIAANDRTNNEFYTCPTYNYAIKNGKRIGIYTIDQEKMHGLGIPEDLNAYLARFHS